MCNSTLDSDESQAHRLTFVVELAIISAVDVTGNDLLDTEELAELLSVAPATLRAMRSQPDRHRRIDGLPDPLRMISGRPVWSRSEIEGWLDHRTRR